ncbi:hypothetical protein FXO37_22328 [Capsicum annuum]|nr:hypothetical protein FXO37_22328 [Capsicum annuum]
MNDLLCSSVASDVLSVGSDGGVAYEPRGEIGGSSQDEDEYLSVFDGEEYDHQDDGGQEEEGTIHDDGYTEAQYTACSIVGMYFHSVQSAFAFYKEHSRLTYFGIVKKSAKQDLKNILKAHFKAYLDWDDDMATPNVPDFDSNSDATFIGNSREVRSHRRHQSNKNISSHQNAFRRDGRRWGFGYYDV